MLARRTLSVFFALLAGVTVLAAPASAAPNYPPGRPPSIELPATTVVPDESVTVTFPDWMAKAPIVVTVSEANGPKPAALGLPADTQASVVPSAFKLATASDCGPGKTCTVMANSKGTGWMPTAFPKAGRYVISARGIGSDGKAYSLSASLKVLAPVAAKPSAAGLPHTGADLTTLWAGMGLLFAGALLVSVSRARRRITI